LSVVSSQLSVEGKTGEADVGGRLKSNTKSAEVSWDVELPHHERIEDAALRHAVGLVDAGDVEGLRRWLEGHPKLAQARAQFEGENYFQTPTLLEFVAENPVRNGRLPENIVAIATVILDAGVERAAVNETLGLVATGCVARECGVQVPLIELLVEHGADAAGALRGAALHGETEAAEALMERGARMDLAVAAALGRVEEFRRLLPGADGEERHLALAGAARFGHTEIVRALLDAGEDPSRYNPEGSHSHSTPLHQAALAGHAEVVRLLVERGARLDRKDLLWQGTPADWAKHEGRVEVERYLRGQEGERGGGKS
jgi:hypothetical protein